MHNNVERIQVALDEIEYYQSLGWILGGLSPQKQKENISKGVKPCAELPDVSTTSTHTSTSLLIAPISSN